MAEQNRTALVKSAQRKKLAGIIIVVCILAFSLVTLFSSNQKHKEEATAKDEFTSPLKRIDTESIILEKTQKALHSMKMETEKLQEKVDYLSEFKKSQEQLNQDMNNKLQSKTEAKEIIQNNSFPQNNAMQGSESFQGNYIPEARSNNVSTQAGYPQQGIREDHLSLARAYPLKLPLLKTPETYVPAGTFVKAVMLGGADASAAVNAQANPVPMLFRIIEQGTLPNHKKSHLKNCIVTAAVIGDISSERGQIRLENLSCTFSNNEIVDQTVEGTIFGPEGKNGVRGTPVWRDGPIIQRAFASGFLSGVANGVSNSYNTNSISAQGTVQTLEPSKIFQNGLASGAGKSMDKLADYNIQRAEQYHPVIQLSAGTVVDIVFLKGFFLDGKKHQDKNDSVGHYNSSINQPSFLPTPMTNQNAIPSDQLKQIQNLSSGNPVPNGGFR